MLCILSQNNTWWQDGVGLAAHLFDLSKCDAKFADNIFDSCATRAAALQLRGRHHHYRDDATWAKPVFEKVQAVQMHPCHVLLDLLPL